MTTRVRSIRVLLFCFAPITLWAFCFFLIYGAETIACVPTVSVPRMAIWVLAIVAASAIAAGAYMLAARRVRLKRNGDGAEGFLAKASVGLAGLAALAMIWIVFATATIPPCAAPS